MKQITIITVLLISFCSKAQMFTKELIGATIADDAFDVHSVDIDGDGYKDIVAGSRAFYLSSFDKISWYKNMGDNTFTQKRDISQSTSTIQKIITIDFDQDGDIDVLSGTTEFSNDSKILLHRNLGNGEFAAPEVLITTNDYYYNFYVFDIDNDGFNDIISRNGYTGNTGPTRCYKNFGNGNLAAPVNLTGFTPGASIKLIEDVDNDSLIDIVLYDSHNIDLLKNLGNMTFTTIDIYDPPYASDKVNCADLNFDGNTDIIVSNSSSSGNPLSWIENLGNANFSSVDSLNVPGVGFAKQVSTHDFDNDGDMDIIYSESNQYNNVIKWLENDGLLNFSSGYELFNCGSSQCDDSFFLMDDFNSDGNEDVVITSPNSRKIRVSYSDQLGEFGSLIDIAGQTERMLKLFKFDVDNDGDTDIISVNFDLSSSYYVISWYENIQNGVFTGRKIIDRISDLMDIRKSDINSDGNIDLLVSLPNTVSSDKIVCYENLGNGNFGLGVHISTSETHESYHQFNLGDINNDGLLEIVYYDNTSGLHFHENLGNLSFSASQNGPNASYVDDLVIADIDEDGNQDIILSTTYGSINWMRNLGSGSFDSNSVLTSSSSSEPSKFRLVDIDSDLDLDIVYGVDSIFWAENDGTGNFQNINLIDPSFSPESELEVSDVDGDGDIDVVSSIWQGGKTRWIENNGLGGFTTTHEVNTNETYSPSPSTYDQLNILCFDMDNDSDQEIFISLRDSLMVMRNNLVSPNQVSGTTFYDENQNGVMDSNEYIVPQIEIATDNGGAITYSNSNGRYYLDFGNLSYNTYQVTPELPYNWQVTNNPQSYGVNYNAGFISIDSVDFGIYPSVAVDSVEASLTGGFPRCNDTINYWLNIKNVGSTIASGVLHLELENQIDFYQSDIQPDSVVGNDMYWSYDSLYYYQNETITIQVILPDFNSIGDTLSSTINGDVYNQSGNSVYHSESGIEQLLVCAYDPNDKVSAQAKFDPLGYIPVTQEYLDYTIRFQNTGNDTARVVVIKDQLDSNLIWNSISTISSSHEMDFNIDVDGLITFTFNEIYLPDSNVNFNGSQGFVKFKIGVEPNLFAETQIKNHGQIYFDLNPAVITNTRINTIDSTGSSLSTDKPFYALNPISIYPNPFNNSTTVDFGEDTNSKYRLSIYDMYGRKVFAKENITERKFIIHERDISKGLFIVVIQNDEHEFISTKKIICR